MLGDLFDAHALAFTPEEASLCMSKALGHIDTKHERKNSATAVAVR